MADNWDTSDDEPVQKNTTNTTTTNNNNTNITTNTTTTKSNTNTNANPNNTNSQQSSQKKRKKRKRNKKKKKQQKKQIKDDDDWGSDSDDDIKKKNKNKNKSKNKRNQQTQANNQNNKSQQNNQNIQKNNNKSPININTPKPTNKNDNKNKNKKKIQNIDDFSGDSDDDDDTTSASINTKNSKPIWRPEQNYVYKPLNYDYEPSYIQRDDVLLKMKRGQTFEDVIKIFELKNGLNDGFNSASVSSSLLEIYGINIYNNFKPIYENVGDDNHRPFMIELDSLLLDIFSSPLISSSMKYGIRIKSVIYLLTNHLDLLFGGGRSAQILIFNCNKYIYKYHIHYIYRCYIIYYLLYYWQNKQKYKYNIKYPLVFQFESFWDNSFSDYIYQYLPVFALISRPDYNIYVCNNNRYLFIYLTIYLMTLQIPCVQSTEITFKSNALYGFTIHSPDNIIKFILNRFRFKNTSSSSGPIQLKPLLYPNKPNYLKQNNIPILNTDTLTNLSFISSFIDNTINKLKIRRLSIIYSLISMYRNMDNINKYDYDFIKLLLLHLIILENSEVANKCRSQMLPKLNIKTKSKDFDNVTNATNTTNDDVSWLDLDDSDNDNDDDDVGDDMDDDDDEKKKDQNSKNNVKQLKDYDLYKIIRECWWTKIDGLSTKFNEFYMHCSVFLAQYLDEFENKINEEIDKNKNQTNNGNDNDNNKFDINSYAHFNESSFADCLDFRIIFYLISVNNKYIEDNNNNKKKKKQKKKQYKWLLNEKSIINNIYLTQNELTEFKNLYAIITDELPLNNNNANHNQLYPIIQSHQLSNISFISSEYEDGTLNDGIVIDPSITNSFIKIDSNLIDTLMPDLESELASRNLLYKTNKVSGRKERNNFFKKYEWINGGEIMDGIKPYKYDHRNYMIFQTFIQKYAQSLEGGKIVLRDVIVAKKKTDSSTNKTDDKNQKYQQQNYKHKKKGKAVTDVRLLAELEVKKKVREKQLEKISNLIKYCSTMYRNDIDARIRRLDEELEGMNDPITALPGLTKLHEWCTQAALNCNPERNMYPVVHLWQITFDIFRRFVQSYNPDSDDNKDKKEDLLPDISLIHNLQKSLHCIGFESPAKTIAEIYFNKKKGKYTLSEILIPFNIDAVCVSVNSSYSRFQMEHCGPFMIRGVGSRPDPRVTGFYPDAWQVKLLDIVDNRYSGLVVAPTSSGKTFVSYYCMKEILQQNKIIKNPRDRGIVIYVSPTKALTWQACADIYSKYGDVFGVLTPDYDHKPLECSVLVCVPSSFEKLLMSSQRTLLHKQIKYVIFDEIHCLGKSEGGEIWERLLMMIRSPFLALSATVGHPLKLKKWLNTISNVLQTRTDEYKHKVKIIIHKERWSYLEKYIYLPPKYENIYDLKMQKDIYLGCYDKDIGWKSSILPIHPVGAIGLTQNNNILDVYDGFPPLTFSPNDCVTLYDQMIKYVNNLPASYKQRLIKLKPDEFFKNDLYITKNRTTQYEKLLKKELKSWIVGYNKQSQIIDIDIYDIDDDAKNDDIDEKLNINTLSAQNDQDMLSKLSKKERKKFQRKLQMERIKKQKQLKQANKRKRKGNKNIKTTTTTATTTATKPVATTSTTATPIKAVAVNTDNIFSDEKEEILSRDEKKVRRQIVDKLLNEIASYTLERINKMEIAFNHQSCSTSNIIKSRDIYSFDFVLNNFINLVIDLHSDDRLPTLAFCLDRVECEKLYLRLLSDLEYLEEKIQQKELGSGNSREADIERRRRLKKLEKARKKAAKNAEKAEKSGKRGNKDVGLDGSGRGPKGRFADGNDDGGDILGGDIDFDNSNRTDYRFTLFDAGDEMDSDEVSFWTQRLIRKTHWSSTHPLMKGLSRGIGLHHEALPLQYRHLVETLFRAKQIKLVVTVASLAMGVNMPARSVVFAGDNKSLDPLNYRQMMGRAGRRGYDNIGHVIFFGINPRKISYLMTSQLTSLNGHYPIISSSSALRCTKLIINGSADDEMNNFQYYNGLVKNLFNEPFNYISPSIINLNQKLIQSKFRYSVEFQIQNGLLSPNNLNLNGLGDLAAVLHEYEPNNFVFVNLLQSGLLHRICKGYTKLKGDITSALKKRILYKLLLILSSIFELYPFPISYKPVKSRKYLNKSYLILPRNELEKEREICETINKYKYNYYKSHFYKMYNKIFGDNTNNISSIYGSENQINFIKYYLKYNDGGIYGHNQIFFEDFRGRNMEQNSYIYDFYLHEDYRRIITESSLRDGLAWQKIKKFQLLLHIINKSLNDISSLKTKQLKLNDVINKQISDFENSLEKIRQHKYSIYRRQKQLWRDKNDKTKEYTKKEINEIKSKLKLQAIGDDFVMAFKDLEYDFKNKFKNISMTGPISNYGSNTTTNTAANDVAKSNNNIIMKNNKNKNNKNNPLQKQTQLTNNTNNNNQIKIINNNNNQNTTTTTTTTNKSSRKIK